MSVNLDHLTEGAWSLDEFVEQANSILPDLLPKDAGKRAAEPVNQRLVRHYATQGLLDDPLKEGREARYLYRHLLQLLVVRRLLAEGFTAAVVGQVLERRSDQELEGLLSGRLRIELVPQPVQMNERAEFLKQVRAKAGLEPGPTSRRAAAGPISAADNRVVEPTSIPASKSRAATHAAADEAAPAPRHYPAAPFEDRTWSHVTIMDGLQLLVRDDFRLPDNRLGDAELTQLLRVTLLYLEQKQRGKP